MKARYHIKPLAEVIGYRNEHVIFRFTELFEISSEESTDIFVDCMKWLWLAAVAQDERQQCLGTVPPKLAIDNSLSIIDEMWHNFLCFTKEYQQFCKENFGVFIHHNPTTKDYNEKLKSQIKKDAGYQRRRRELQYSYIYDKLGEDVLVKWYDHYDKVYPADRIKQLRRK